jgi:hypothetical protein
MQFPRGGCHRAGTGNGDQHPQPSGVQHAFQFIDLIYVIGRFLALDL